MYSTSFQIDRVPWAYVSILFRFEDEENFHCISGKESTRGIDIFLFLWSLDNRYIIVFLPNVIVITIAGEDTVDKL